MKLCWFISSSNKKYLPNLWGCAGLYPVPIKISCTQLFMKLCWFLSSSYKNLVPNLWDFAGFYPVPIIIILGSAVLNILFRKYAVVGLSLNFSFKKCSIVLRCVISQAVWAILIIPFFFILLIVIVSWWNVNIFQMFHDVMLIYFRSSLGEQRILSHNVR